MRTLFCVCLVLGCGSTSEPREPARPTTTIESTPDETPPHEPARAEVDRLPIVMPVAVDATQLSLPAEVAPSKVRALALGERRSRYCCQCEGKFNSVFNEGLSRIQAFVNQVRFRAAHGHPIIVDATA